IQRALGMARAVRTESQLADRLGQRVLSGEIGNRPIVRGRDPGNLYPHPMVGSAPEAARRPAMFAFAGENAKTADHAALSKAKEMESNGVDRNVIWKETGWGRGRDGKWIFEIKDPEPRERATYYPSSGGLNPIHQVYDWNYV